MSNIGSLAKVIGNEDMRIQLNKCGFPKKAKVPKPIKLEEPVVIESKGEFIHECSLLVNVSM